MEERSVNEVRKANRRRPGARHLETAGQASREGH